MKNWGLVLDDTRTIDESLAISKITCFKEEFEFFLAKNFQEFQQIIEERGCPTVVSFDHDLGLDETEQLSSGIFLASWAEKSGLTCAKWLVEYCHENKIRFPTWYVHSANPVGKHNIKSYIESAIRAGYVE